MSADTAGITLAAGTSGQVLQTNGSGAAPSWVTPSGGGGGGSVPNWVTKSPDTPPASADAMDDEFDAGSLDAKWTWVNQSTATATLSNSCLVLYDPAHSGDNKRYIYQAAPSTPWEFTAKVSLVGKIGNFLSGGLIFSDSTGKIIEYSMGVDGNPMIAVIHYNSPSSFSGYASTLSPQPISCMYLKVKNDGTNLIFSFCFDGVGFLPQYSESRTAFLSSGPTRVGLFVDANNTGADALISSDWFRRTL
jgi:hypothetical protein